MTRSYWAVACDVHIGQPVGGSHLGALPRPQVVRETGHAVGGLHVGAHGEVATAGCAMAIKPGVGLQLVGPSSGKQIARLLLAAGDTAGGASAHISPTPAIAVASRFIVQILPRQPEQNLRCGYSS